MLHQLKATEPFHAVHGVSKLLPQHHMVVSMNKLMTIGKNLFTYLTLNLFLTFTLAKLLKPVFQLLYAVTIKSLYKACVDEVDIVLYAL